MLYEAVKEPLLSLLRAPAHPPEPPLGSPGSDEIRWLRPVRPGDTLRARFTIVDVVPSRSKPDRGIVRTYTEVLNQQGEIVMTHRGLGMFGRRPPAAARA